MAWTQSSRVALRKYLRETKSELLGELRNSTPHIKIDEQSKIEGIALTSAQKEGWELAIRHITGLAANTKEEGLSAETDGFADMSAN